MPRVGELKVWTFFKIKFGGLRILFGGYEEKPSSFNLDLWHWRSIFFFWYFFLPFLSMNFDKQQ